MNQVQGKTNAVTQNELTVDQRLLLDTSRRFIEATFPLEAVRKASAEDADPGDAYWAGAAEIGWFAMLVPEADGGGCVSDNNVVDATVIAKARGAYLQPGAFVGTNVVAQSLPALGTEQQKAEVLPQLVNGQLSATWAAMGPAEPSPYVGVTAYRGPSGFVLNGVKTLVQDAHRARWMLVTASGHDGVSQFLIPSTLAGVRVTPLDGLDITRRFFEVSFESVAVDERHLVGAPGQARQQVERQLDVACVLTAGESVGAMERNFSLALQYAKDRTAFGRPIGSFQAIKHLLADTSLSLEMAKCLLTAAATLLGEGSERSSAAASMAKAFVGEVGIELVQNCFQVFGGIGFTWEHDHHLYLRRLTAEASLFGSPAWHRERLWQLEGL